MNKLKHIIFGGTFDPWTPAHEEIVRRLCKNYPEYDITIIPTCVTWHRADKKPMFPLDDRLAIIQRRLHDSRLIHIGSIHVDSFEYKFARAYPEARRGFIDTLRQKAGEWAYMAGWTKESSDIKFVVGQDEWELFPSWKESQEILKLAKPIVVTRPGESQSGLDGVEVLTIDEKFSSMSASKIRKMFENRSMTPEEYCSDKDVWSDALIQLEPVLMCKTPIFTVWHVPSDDPTFRPIRVKSPDWVCVIADATPEGGREMVFRCVSQRRWGTGLMYDEFVTGVVDDGESPRQAAQRELKEELGIDCHIDSLKPLGVLATNPGFMNNFMHYYYVKLTEKGIKKTEPKLDPHEKLVPVDVTRNELFHEPSSRPALMMAGLTLLASAIAKGEVSCG